MVQYSHLHHHHHSRAHSLPWMFALDGDLNDAKINLFPLECCAWWNETMNTENIHTSCARNFGDQTECRVVLSSSQGAMMMMMSKMTLFFHRSQFRSRSVPPDGWRILFTTKNESTPVGGDWLG